jgi:hypothetical protein
MITFVVNGKGLIFVWLSAAFAAASRINGLVHRDPDLGRHRVPMKHSRCALSCSQSRSACVGCLSPLK